MADSVNRFKYRARAAAPHIGALTLGSILFLIRAVVGFPRSADQGVTGRALVFAYLTILMIAPLIGAHIGARAHNDIVSHLKQVALKPYRIAAYVGVLTVAAVELAAGSDNRFGNATGAEQIISNTAFLAMVLATTIIPIVMPFLRSVIWFFSPPEPLPGLESGQ